MRAGVIIFTLATSVSWLVPIKVAAQCDSLLQSITSDSGYVWASTRIDGDTTHVALRVYTGLHRLSREYSGRYHLHIWGNCPGGTYICMVEAHNDESLNQAEATPC